MEVLKSSVAGLGAWEMILARYWQHTCHFALCTVGSLLSV